MSDQATEQPAEQPKDGAFDRARAALHTVWLNLNLMRGGVATRDQRAAVAVNLHRVAEAIGEAEIECEAFRVQAAAYLEDRDTFSDRLTTLDQQYLDLARAWKAQPCVRCGGPRDYTHEGQLQVVCHACAKPLPAPALTPEEHSALAYRVRRNPNTAAQFCVPKLLRAVDELRESNARLAEDLARERARAAAKEGV